MENVTEKITCPEHGSKMKYKTIANFEIKIVYGFLIH